MAKARILTWNPEQASRIQQHLIAFGFDVEIAPPTALRHSPAELEINLEECEVQEALRRAALAPPGTEIIVAASVFQRTQTVPGGVTDAIPTDRPSAAGMQNSGGTPSVSDRPVSGAFLVASREAGVKVPNYLREMGGRARARTLTVLRSLLAMTAAWLASVAQRLGSLSGGSTGTTSAIDRAGSHFSSGWIRSTVMGAAAIVVVLAVVFALEKYKSPTPTPQASETSQPAATSPAASAAAVHTQTVSKRTAAHTHRQLTSASQRLSPARRPVRHSAQRATAAKDKDEVVVRYFHPRRNTTIQAKSDGVKHYSDRDKY